MGATDSTNDAREQLQRDAVDDFFLTSGSTLVSTRNAANLLFKFGWNAALRSVDTDKIAEKIDQLVRTQLLADLSAGCAIVEEWLKLFDEGVVFDDFATNSDEENKRVIAVTRDARKWLKDVKSS